MAKLENYWDWHWDSDVESGHRDQFNFLGCNKLASNFVFIRDDYVFDCLYEESQEYFINQIELCVKTKKRIPIFCLDNNIFDVSRVDEILQKSLGNKEYFILTYNADMLHSVHPNIGYWPYFLIRQYLENNLLLNTAPTPHSKKFRLSYLSGISRYHRLLLASKLKRHFSDEDVVVVNDFNIPAYIDTIPSYLMTDEKTRKNAIALVDDFPWGTNKRYFDNDHLQECIKRPWDISHPAYKAAVNITGETSYSDDEIFITEKTWKAYQAGSLVINYGTKNLPVFLKKMGIEIVEDIDPPLIFSEKIDFLDTCFENIDMWDLYHKNKKLINYNMNLVYSEPFLNYLLAPTIEKLQDIIS